MRMFGGLDLFSDRTALLSSDGKSISYEHLLKQATSLSRQLPGRRLVLVVASNNPKFVTGYVGFLRAGMAQLIVGEAIAPEFLAKIISIYSPEYAFFPKSMAEKPMKGELKYEDQDYQLIKLADSKFCKLHPDLALLLSTSGTTGSPKMVRISFQNLHTNTESILGYLEIQSTDRTITTMPLSYSYGLSILNTHLTAGASIVMTDASVVSREFWNILRDKSVTSLGGVPYFFEMLRKLKFEKMDLPLLHTITQAGGKLGAALAREFTDICLNKKIRFYIMYGQTEATARMSYLCATDHPSKSESIGQAIPGGKLWLQDEAGERVTTAGVAGELVYYGANVSMGYAENQVDLASGDLNGGILRTGDLATCDQDGFYTIVGRKNRFLKVFGLRVNLFELEEVLRGKNYECACAGTDQKLIIYLTNIDAQAKIESLVFELTGIHKNGFEVVKIDAIPRTASGKINYKALDDLRE